MAKRKGGKTGITGKQRAARKRNIAVARMSRKKNAIFKPKRGKGADPKKIKTATSAQMAKLKTKVGMTAEGWGRK